MRYWLRLRTWTSKVRLVVAASLALAHGSATAATFCVNSADDLASALRASQSNRASDVIRLVQGTYQGTFAYESAEAFDLTLEGGYVAGCGSRTVSAANTVLDGGNAGTVLTVYSSGLSTISVDGLTLQHGRTSSEAAGLLVPCCRDNLVSLGLTNSVVRQNTAVEGSFASGGVRYSGYRSLTVSNTVIEENSGGYEGGGLAVNGGLSITLARNTIRHNTAAGTGGGMNVRTGFCGATVRVVDNVVTANTAGNQGGGVLLETNCISNVVITNNSFADNYAPAGGGLHLKLGPETAAASLFNNVLWGNRAAQGADFYLNNDGDGIGLPSPVGLENNDLDQSAAGTFLRVPFSIASSNLKNLDPLFVNLAQGDAHLQAGSPAIDAGTNDAPGLPSIDRDGKPRIAPAGGRVDLGACEYQPAATVPDFSVEVSPGSWTAEQGEAAVVSVSTVVTGGFSGVPSLSAFGLPAGSTAIFSPASIPAPGSGSSRLTITTSPSTIPGAYPLTVTAAGNERTRTAQLLLTVLPGTASETRLVPIALNVSSGSAHYTTELALTNATSRAKSVSLHYVPSLGPKAGEGTAADFLAPGEQRIVPDALAYLRGLGLPVPPASDEPVQGGTVLVTFKEASAGDSRLLSVTARTTSATASPLPAGRAGLAYAGQPLTGARATPATIFGLRSSTADRSNVAVFNGSDVPVSFRVTVSSGSGDGRSVEFKAAETLPGWGWLQYSSTAILDGTGIANGWVTVEQTSTAGSLGAYGVVNDNVTNDGSFLLPAAGVPIRAFTIPALVETQAYSSELTLSNKSTRPVTLILTYVESLSPSGGSGGSTTVTLQPSEQRITALAIDFLRGSGVSIGPRGVASYGGALRVTVSGGTAADVFAGARTASAVPGGGEFGLFAACVPSGHEAEAEAFLYGLRADTENRTNVAVVNAGDDAAGPILLQLQAFDGDAGGVPRGDPFSVTLTPGQWAQPSDFFRNSGVANGWVRVVRMSGSSPWIAYGVINDGARPGERTGDGAYVPMVK